MIYSIFGTNDFKIILELDKLIDTFVLKNYQIYRYNFNNQTKDNDNIQEDNEDTQKEVEDLNNNQENILTTINHHLNIKDLFNSNKIIIIKYLKENDLPKKDYKFLQHSLEKIENDKNIITIFASKKPLKLLENLKTKKIECKKFETNQLNEFIEETAKTNNVKLTLKAKNLLISFFNNDIGIIYNEIIKLSNYKNNINDTDILDLIQEPNLSNIFSFTDAISARNKELAIKLLWQEYNSGTYDLMIYGIVISQIRNAILVKEQKKHPEIKIDVHPYVQKKLMPLVNNFELKQLKTMYAQLFKYDLQLKKGKINAILALELFIAKYI